MHDVTKIFALRLREKRRALGLTQRALAERLGYSEKAVSKWESGAALPPTVLLPTLASILGTSIDALLAETEEIRYYLGVDGGGTKTEFVLASADGTVEKRVLLGGSNPNDVGLPAALDVLNRGILACCGSIPRGCISVFAGLSGGITGNNQEKIREALASHRFGRADNGSDAENAVAAGLGRDDGIAVILGTGVIAFAQSAGKRHRVGGYGYLFLDDGSGFAIGRDGIVAALECEAGYGTETALYPLVKEKCGGGAILPHLSDFYAGGKRTVASYAPLVFEAAKSGDAVARTILEKHARAVAVLIRAAARYVEAPSDASIPVALTGGVTKNESLLLPLLRAALGEDAARYEVTVTKKTPVCGALIKAGLENELKC